jgi:tripartite-type tricarboxylate transporter receptor subunit TctC
MVRLPLTKQLAIGCPALLSPAPVRGIAPIAALHTSKRLPARSDLAARAAALSSQTKTRILGPSGAGNPAAGTVRISREDAMMKTARRCARRRKQQRRGGPMHAHPRRHFGFAIVAAIALFLSQPPCPAQAQDLDYPARKVTFIVGFAAGGGVDTMARIVAQGLSEQFGYQVVIENRPGAASNIAAKAVASATPDGYTFLFSGNSLAINQTFYKNLSYSIDDLRVVAIAAIDSYALAINANKPFPTLATFLDASHDQPFTFGYGGSSAHIVAEYIFKVLAKAPAIGVPYQSGMPAMNALLGNHVDIIAGPVAEIYPQVQQGGLRALAVTGARRAQAFPDVPTLSQVGFPGLETDGWIGLLAPAKTPADICAKLNAAVNAVVAKPGIEKRLRELGYEPSAVALADTATILRSSIEKWGAMIRATGITAE